MYMSMSARTDSLKKSASKQELKTARIRQMRLIVPIAIAVIFFMFGAWVHAYAMGDVSPETAAGIQSADEAASPAPAKTVVAMRGDTLWSIAKANAPEESDIRDYIYRLKQENQLKTSGLYIGQVLRLPEE